MVIAPGKSAPLRRAARKNLSLAAASAQDGAGLVSEAEKFMREMSEEPVVFDDSESQLMQQRDDLLAQVRKQHRYHV